MYALRTWNNQGIFTEKEKFFQKNLPGNPIAHNHKDFFQNFATRNFVTFPKVPHVMLGKTCRLIVTFICLKIQVFV